jgi:hypothetical protein
VASGTVSVEDLFSSTHIGGKSRSYSSAEGNGACSGGLDKKMETTVKIKVTLVLENDVS